MGFFHVRKNCLLLPLSSTISTRPGFSCSMEGTWLARTPISPDSAGRLTWTTSWDLKIDYLVRIISWLLGSSHRRIVQQYARERGRRAEAMKSAISLSLVRDAIDEEGDNVEFYRKVRTWWGRDKLSLI